MEVPVLKGACHLFYLRVLGYMGMRLCEWKSLC